MSGVSTRTLRYYGEIGLLKPARAASSGYRIYSQDQVDVLQQILFFRELEFSLDEIKKLLTDPGFDRQQAFENHLHSLQNKQERLGALIENVKCSLSAMKGEITMSDQEKFAGFAQKLIDENEQKYGTEIRAKYGDKAVDDSNAHLKGMTKDQYEQSEKLRIELEEKLMKAFEAGDPSGELAHKACELHKQWLCIFYPNYSKEYHRGLADMYVADERFKANYEKLGVGCTEFFRNAIIAYAK